MKKIEVRLKNNPYQVSVNCDVTGQLTKYFEKNKYFELVLFVIDRNVFKLHNTKIKSIINIWKNKKHKIIIPATEKNKSYNTLQKIHSVLLRNKFGRDSLIISIGGGIIGDITGFAAATYMRGIPYIQIPTTLLAMVDSSVGGKTGINFLEKKNIIGSFYQPASVIIDFSFLSTLTKEERICGLGEIVKYAFLTNENFFKYLLRNTGKFILGDYKNLNFLIYESLNFKTGVVLNDEKEKGLRKVLNLGHTFAHALEVEQKYKIKHGMAVIWGIACSLYLSNRLQILSDENLHKYLSLLEKFKNEIKLSKINPVKIYDIMLSDKKNRKGKIKFVLLKSIGNILIDVEAGRENINKSVKDAYMFFAT